MAGLNTLYGQLTNEEYAYLKEHVFPYNEELQVQENFIIFQSKYALFDFLYKKNQSDHQVLFELLQKLNTLSIEECYPDETILDYLLNVDYSIQLPGDRWIYFPPQTNN